MSLLKHSAPLHRKRGDPIQYYSNRWSYNQLMLCLGCERPYDWTQLDPPCDSDLRSEVGGSERESGMRIVVYNVVAKCYRQHDNRSEAVVVFKLLTSQLYRATATQHQGYNSGDLLSTFDHASTTNGSYKARPETEPIAAL